MGEWSPKNGSAPMPTIVDRLAEPAVIPPGKRYKCPRCLRLLKLDRCIACEAQAHKDAELARKRREMQVQAREQAIDSETCRIGGCSNKPHARGLCHRCYRNAAAQVSRGQTSWHELEELGLIRPAYKREASAAFSVALAQARAQRN